MKSPVTKTSLRLLVLAAAMTASIGAYAQGSIQEPATEVADQGAIPATLIEQPAEVQNVQPGTTQWQMTAEQKNAAALAAQKGVHVSEIQTNAPSSYTVKSGDTLWDISARFLKSPWKWPALWGMNQSQIRNPHRIYSGQVLVLVRNGDRAMLQFGQHSGAMPTVKLGPRVRSEHLEDTSLPVLPPEAVIPFLKHGVIIPRNEFEKSPRIVATPENRLLLREGDKVYVRGGNIDPAVQPIYMVYTKPEPVRDPVTNDVLGFQAKYLGRLQYSRAGAPGNATKYDDLETTATFVVLEANQELRVGDHLTPASSDQDLLTDFVPSAAPAGIEGRIVDLYGNSIRHSWLYQVVLLGKGHLDGLERGNVVALSRPGKTVVDKTVEVRGYGLDRTDTRYKKHVKTPEERYGLAMVFRTYDHLSYAIIMKASDSVELGDSFTAP